jgi:hypothetical protein
MNNDDLIALRQLHRLISRTHSVHAAYAPALERAIEDFAAQQAAWTACIPVGNPTPSVLVGLGFNEHGQVVRTTKEEPHWAPDDQMSAVTRPSMAERMASGSQAAALSAIRDLGEFADAQEFAARRERQDRMAEYQAQAAEKRRPDIRGLIANDGFAASFQSLGQYRAALLKALGGTED